jgi:hypothetical protein
MDYRSEKFTVSTYLDLALPSYIRTAFPVYVYYSSSLKVEAVLSSETP